MNPCIANIVGQFFYGRAVDDKGRQENYISKFSDKCSPDMIKWLKEDTKHNRLKWFREALDSLASSIQNEGEKKIMRIFFPYWIGCGTANGKQEDYLAIIQKFTRQMAKLDIVVYLVVSPDDNESKFNNNYHRIPPAQSAPHQLSLIHI